MELNAAGADHSAFRKHLAQTVEAQRRNSAPLRTRTQCADLPFACDNSRAGLRRKAIETHRHRSRARRTPMLDARNHLLADKAAFAEIDPAELIHVGLVGESFAVDEIKSAARDRMRDPMRLVGDGIHPFGSELRRCLAR